MSLNSSVSGRGRPVPAPRLSKLGDPPSLVAYDRSPRHPQCRPPAAPAPPARSADLSALYANANNTAASNDDCSSTESPLSAAGSAPGGLKLLGSADNVSEESAFVSGGHQSGEEEDGDGDPAACPVTASTSTSSSGCARTMSVENPEYFDLATFRSMAGLPDPSDVLNSFDPLASSPKPAVAAASGDRPITSTSDLLSSLMEAERLHQRSSTDSDDVDTQSIGDADDDEVPSTSKTDINGNVFNGTAAEESDPRDALRYSGGGGGDLKPFSRAQQVISMADTISVGTQFGALNDFRESKLTLKTEDLRSSLVPIGQSVCYCGWTTLQRGAQAQRTQRLWATLKHGTLAFYTDDNDSDASPVLSILCSDIQLLAPSVPALANSHSSKLGLRNSSFSAPTFTSPSTPPTMDGGNWFSVCYRTYTPKAQPLINLIRLGVDEKLELTNWMLLLAKVCAPCESVANMITAAQLAGRFYAKQGVAGDWQSAWGYLNGKSFCYVFELQDDVNSLCVDLRKVVRVSEVGSRSDWQPVCAAQAAIPPFLLTKYGSSLCIQTEFDIVTNALRYHVEREINRVSGQLDEQRLTSDDVLLIVDKCIRFIGMHGLHEEGIYRKPGSRAQVTRMLLELTKEPHEHVLQLDCDGTVHSAATAYRRYIREYLDQPLFPKHLQSKFFTAASQIHVYDDKIAAYKEAVAELPRVQYATLRKIFSHLKECTDYCSTNKATVDNVAVVFGPTLMTVQNDVEDSFEDACASGQHGVKRQVVHDMITAFNTIFDVSDEEIRQNVKLASQVDQMHQAIDGALSKKPAGSFLVSVHVQEKDNRPFNVQSEKTAGQVVEFSVDHCGLEPLGHNWKLFECVRNGQLKRLVFAEERLTDIVVCRWYNWKEEERGQCYLLIEDDTWLQRLGDLDLDPFANEVKFADRGSKSYKKCSFRYSQGRVDVMKDMKAKNPTKSFNANDLLWWFGCEKKREAPYKHTLTFIDKADVPQPNKFFGYSMAFKSSVDMLRWAATVLSIKTNT